MTGKNAKMNVKEDNSSRLTAAIIDELVGNEDLLIEILLRVPAKSLVKFKCVSKCWLSLISDQNFCYNHCAQSPKGASAIYYYSDLSSLKAISLKGHQNLPTLPLSDGVNEGYSISVIHACNGLMLCWRNYCHEKFICICNLTTNKYTVLLQGCASSNPVLLACISYDPAKSPYYKVVLTRRKNLIDIYFSENKSWKRIQVTERLNKPHHKAFWDGSIHWIHSLPKTHLKFDVDKETLTTFNLPPKPSFLRDEMIHYFGGCGENLILIQYRPRVTVGFIILEMKKGATLWTVKQRVNLRPITQSYPGYKEFHVLSVLKESLESTSPKKVSLESGVVLILASHYKIFKYNLRCKTAEAICDFDVSEFFKFGDHRNSCHGRVYHFIESLAPV